MEPRHYDSRHNDRQRNRPHRYQTFLFITALVVLAVLLIGLSAVQPTKGGISGDDTSNGTGSIVAVDGSNIADTHMLALVNRDHQVSADFAPPDLVDASPVLPVDTVAEKLNATALEALVKMIGDADDAISGGLMLLSGYRSYDQQEQTYSAAEDKSYVQTPGSSEHEIGLAADISMDDGTGLSPSAVGWLAEHSWEYGFILRYPQGQHAQESTGISYEPWHFRYVGEPHAWYCTKHGITFEEYVDMLKSKGGYTATLENVEFTVRYEKPQDGKMKVPSGTDGDDFTISSDNTGGYIVTAWKKLG